MTAAPHVSLDLSRLVAEVTARIVRVHLEER